MFSFAHTAHCGSDIKQLVYSIDWLQICTRKLDVTSRLGDKQISGKSIFVRDNSSIGKVAKFVRPTPTAFIRLWYRESVQSVDFRRIWQFVSQRVITDTHVYTTGRWSLHLHTLVCPLYTTGLISYLGHSIEFYRLETAGLGLYVIP